MRRSLDNTSHEKETLKSIQDYLRFDVAMHREDGHKSAENILRLQPLAHLMPIVLEHVNKVSNW